MDKKSIIQWNCRGLKANYNEILILMSLFSPSVICLQETFLKQSDNVSFRDFNMFNHICPDGQRASGGTSIMVKSSVPHSQFDLNTNLQAVAVNVTLSKKVTICSIYLPPNDVLSKNSLVNLINQLPQPFMLVGDFNGHSKVWGCSDTNDRGEIIEDVIAENDLCLLNDKQPTYLHPPTGNNYAIDLSLYHPNIFLDFNWSVCDDLHGSDHFPILIEETESSDDEQQCRWNLKKRIGRHLLLYVRNDLHLKSLKQPKICLLSLQHYMTFRKNVFRNPRQGRKDVIHGLMMNVKRQLTNANRHYENLIRIRLVKIICIPS